MVKTTLSERIQQVLRETGRNQRELADDAGVSKALVTQWLNESTQSIGIDVARAIAGVHGYNPAWVMLGELPVNGPDTTFKGRRPRSADINRLVTELEGVHSMGPAGGALVRAFTALVKALNVSQQNEQLTPEMSVVVSKLCAIDKKGGADREHVIQQISLLLADE
jgi:transcriptional regulator with XRE-family HTH domain